MENEEEERSSGFIPSTPFLKGRIFLYIHPPKIRITFSNWLYVGTFFLSQNCSFKLNFKDLTYEHKHCIAAVKNMGVKMQVFLAEPNKQ